MRKKILLTGHLGYLGQQFLQRYGDEFGTIGYDLKEGDDILDYEKLRQYAILQLLHLTWTKVLVRSFILLEYK
jgi:hypothetical protein